MNRTIFAATLTVIALATVASAYFGETSGLFALVEPMGLLLISTPYLGLTLLTWVNRRRPMIVGVLFVIGLFVGGFGLFFLYNDWYWPKPTHPNPWRDFIIVVIAYPQCVVVAATALILAAWSLFARRSGAVPAAKVGEFGRDEV